jgi:hypothetical protein
MELIYKSWKDINVNTFIRLQLEWQNFETTGDKVMDDLNRSIILLSILCDTTEDEITNLSKSEFTTLLHQTVFINDMPKVKIQDKYVINGKKYKVFLTLQDMSISQYIDFQTFYKEQEKYFKELIACFLIPDGKKYGEYDINEVIDDIGNHMTIVDAYSILFFFVLLFRSLTKAILNYSIKDMKKMMKKEKNKEQKMKMEKSIAEMKKAMDSLNDGVGFIS